MAMTSLAKMAKQGKKVAWLFQNPTGPHVGSRLSCGGICSHKLNSFSTWVAKSCACCHRRGWGSWPKRNSSADDFLFKARFGAASWTGRPRPRPLPRARGLRAPAAAAAAPKTMPGCKACWFCKACCKSGLAAHLSRARVFTLFRMLALSSGVKTAWVLKRVSRYVAHSKRAKPLVPSKWRDFVVDRSWMRNCKNLLASGCISRTFTEVAGGLGSGWPIHPQKWP